MSSPADRCLFTPPTPATCKTTHLERSFKSRSKCFSVQPSRTKYCSYLKPKKNVLESPVSIPILPNHIRPGPNMNFTKPFASPVMLSSSFMFSTPKLKCSSHSYDSLPTTQVTSLSSVQLPQTSVKQKISTHTLSSIMPSCNISIGRPINLNSHPRPSVEYDCAESLRDVKRMVTPQAPYAEPKHSFFPCINIPTYYPIGISKKDRSNLKCLKRQDNILLDPEKISDSLSGFACETNAGSFTGYSKNSLTPCKSIISISSPLSSSTCCSSHSSISLKSETVSLRAKRIQSALNKGSVFCDTTKLHPVHHMSGNEGTSRFSVRSCQIKTEAPVTLSCYQTDSSPLNCFPIDVTPNANTMSNDTPVSMHSNRCFTSSQRLSLKNSDDAIRRGSARQKDSPSSSLVNVRRCNRLMSIRNQSLSGERAKKNAPYISLLNREESYREKLLSNNRDGLEPKSMVKRRRTSKGRVIYTLSMEKYEKCGSQNNQITSDQDIQVSFGLTHPHTKGCFDACQGDKLRLCSCLTTTHKPKELFYKKDCFKPQGQICHNAYETCNTKSTVGYQEQVAKNSCITCPTHDAGPLARKPSLELYKNIDTQGGYQHGSVHFFSNPDTQASFVESFRGVSDAPCHVDYLNKVPRGGLYSDKNNAFFTRNATYECDNPSMEFSSSSSFSPSIPNNEESSVKLTRQCMSQWNHSMDSKKLSTSHVTKNSINEKFRVRPPNTRKQYTALTHGCVSIQSRERCTEKVKTSHSRPTEYFPNLDKSAAQSTSQFVSTSQSSNPYGIPLGSDLDYEYPSKVNNSVEHNKRNSLMEACCISKLSHREDENLCFQNRNHCCEKDRSQSQECCSSKSFDPTPPKNFSSPYESGIVLEDKHNSDINTDVVFKILQHLAESNINAGLCNKLSSHESISNSFWAVCCRILRWKRLGTVEGRQQIFRVAMWCIFSFLITGFVAIVIVWSVLHRKRLETSSSFLPYDELLDLTSFNDNLSKDLMFDLSRIL